MGTIHLLGLSFEASYGLFQPLMVAKLLAQSLGAGLFMLGSALVLRALERPRASSRCHFALMVSGALLFTAALFLKYMPLTWNGTWLGVQEGAETWYAMMSSLEITALFLYAIGAFLSFRTLLRGLELDWPYGRYVMLVAIMMTALAAVVPLLSAHPFNEWLVRSLELMSVLSTPLLSIGGALSWRAVLRKDAGGPVFRSFMWIGIAFLAVGMLNLALIFGPLPVFDLSDIIGFSELAYYLQLIGEVMVIAACAHLAVRGTKAPPSERDGGAAPAVPC